MQLYRWDSEYLRGYSQGDIIAMGETVDEAREHARAVQRVQIRDRWGYLFDINDEDSCLEIETLSRLFEQDIAREPEVLTNAVLIRGSD
jgi:hypothetical protein